MLAGSGGLGNRRRLRLSPTLLPTLPAVPLDALAPFGQAIMVIRWGTTVVSLLLASPDVRDGDDRLVVSCALLLAYSVFRTIRPLRYRHGLRSLLAVLGEVVFTVLLVVATGYWESPLAFSLLTAVAVAGFARGFGFGLRIAVVSLVAVTLPWALGT